MDKPSAALATTHMLLSAQGENLRLISRVHRLQRWEVLSVTFNLLVVCIGRLRPRRGNQTPRVIQEVRGRENTVNKGVAPWSKEFCFSLSFTFLLRSVFLYILAPALADAAFGTSPLCWHSSHVTSYCSRNTSGRLSSHSLYTFPESTKHGLPPHSCLVHSYFG